MENEKVQEKGVDPAVAAAAKEAESVKAKADKAIEDAKKAVGEVKDKAKEELFQAKHKVDLAVEHAKDETGGFLRNAAKTIGGVVEVVKDKVVETAENVTHKDLNHDGKIGK